MAVTGLRQLTKREQAIVGKYAAKHGVVLGIERQIADSSHSIGAPLIRLSTLAQLERRGTIAPEEAAAGERFHALFRRAGLDTLAADLSRVPVPGGRVAGDTLPSHERCRRRVADAVAALGGDSSVAASIVWHVVGLEWSIRWWAPATRPPHERACGILIGALAVLAAHFGRRG